MILRKGINYVYEVLTEEGYHFEIGSDIPIRILKEEGLPIVVECFRCNKVMTIAEAYMETEINAYYCPKCAEYVADLIEF